MKVLAVLLALAGTCLYVQAQNVVCGKGTSSKTVTLEDGESYSFKTHKGKKYKGNTECTVDYKMGDTCAEMSFACTKFNTNNKDKKKCKKGDMVTITANGKAKAYCKTKKPKVTSSGDMQVVFSSDAKKHSSGAVCKVTCTEAASTTATTTEAAGGGGAGGRPSYSPSPAPAPAPAPAPVPAPAPAPAPTSSCRCGQANRRAKIVGGVATEENEYPWQVGLLSSRSSSQPFCGGTLISNKEVLTARHCTDGATVSYVTLGEHDLTKADGEQIVRVCGITNNPNFNSQTIDYDFAILTLCDTVTFSTDISPACLPASSSTNYDDRQAVVSGWGTLSQGGDTPSVLQEVTVNTMSNTQCTGRNTAYSSIDITSRMICASASGKDSCQGDSGGPLVTQETGGYYTIIGVVSWGFGCANAQAPGVYARVTSQLSWIRSNVGGSTCPAA